MEIALLDPELAPPFFDLLGVVGFL